MRLRPKLMTVGTSMVGLIPVMWATGTGSDVYETFDCTINRRIVNVRSSRSCCNSDTFCNNERASIKKRKIRII